MKLKKNPIDTNTKASGEFNVAAKVGEATGVVATVAINTPTDFMAGFRKGFKPYQESEDKKAERLNKIVLDIRRSLTSEDAIEAFKAVKDSDVREMASRMGWPEKEFKDRAQALVDALPTEKELQIGTQETNNAGA